MKRPALWKVLTFGAVITGLGMAGAGTASADSGVASADIRSVATAPMPADWPFDDLDGLDDLIRAPFQIPSGMVDFDDDWDGDWDDDWYDD